MTGIKMITCCFCSAREMMSMGKGQRRSLTCQSCGAPIHKIEVVPRAALATKAPHVTGPAKPAKIAPTKVLARKPNKKHTGDYRPPKHKDAYRKKRGKRRKGFFEKLWDDVEDIFDVEEWVEDLFD